MLKSFQFQLLAIIAAANIRMVLPIQAVCACVCVADTPLRCHLPTWMLIRFPFHNRFREPNTPYPPAPIRPFPLTSCADFLEPHISPSSVFLFLSSPQPDSPPGQVPVGGPRG